MKQLKKLLPDLLAILFFVALSFAYFAKPVSEGLVLTGHDHSGGAGASSEMEAYRKSHDGERTRWTNTLFSGMPTYQMAPSYPSTEKLSKVESVYKLWLPDYVVLVFIMLLGFYILLRAFDFKAWMAALGAVLWAFSSYYFIIIGAGHIWKFYTLAYIPPTIAGMVLCYRGRYGWGLLVTAVFMALQILSNHIQMTYYFGFVMVLMSLAFIQRNQWLRWMKATAVFALGCLIGIAVNVSNLYHTWEYSKESMRGKSELTQKTKDPADQTSSGLERSYITAWSYGIGETWSLLIPNVKGGASQPLTQSKTAMEKANPTYMPVYQSLGQYWGEQPGTSGPVYVGAFVVFLFVLGLFIVKGPMKWALFIATLLSITLAWGKNFMPWTDLWLDYVPMYDKFRTVASILVIAEFTIPLLAMLALREIVSPSPRSPRGGEGLQANAAVSSKSAGILSRGGEGLQANAAVSSKSAGILSRGGEGLQANAAVSSKSAGILPPMGGVREGLFALLLTAGPCLLFWLMPDVFFGNYVSSSEAEMLNNAVAQGYIPADMLADILRNLNDMRRAVFTADAGRSLLIILVGCAVLLAYYFKKIKAWAMVVCLLVLCTADMWDVNKRYLNDAMFSKPQPAQQFFQKTPTDEAILQDSDLYYRVVNLAVSTFNDNTTSYWHKSIGGYHAAKLRRYQELIEAHIQPQLTELFKAVSTTGGHLDSIAGDSLFPVLNMLNTKYAILPLQGGQTAPVQNPWAMGNAWFVDDVFLVSNADEELSLLGAINPRTTAAVDVRFREQLPDALISAGGPKVTNDESRITNYELRMTNKSNPSGSSDSKSDSSFVTRHSSSRIPDSSFVIPHSSFLTLTSYEANALTFEAETDRERLAVFSDIYYPGWQCTIDGEPAPILRADYVLRAVVIPAGKHHIAFRFDPQSLHTTEAIANSALIALALLLIALVAVGVWRKRKS